MFLLTPALWERGCPDGKQSQDSLTQHPLPPQCLSGFGECLSETSKALTHSPLTFKAGLGWGFLCL